MRPPSEPLAGRPFLRLITLPRCGTCSSLLVTNKLKHIPQRAPTERRLARSPAPHKNGESSRRAKKLRDSKSCRQGRLTALQEAADGGVALETDRHLVGAAGFAICAGLGQQLRARSPVGLVFGEPDIGRYLWHRL